MKRDPHRSSYMYMYMYMCFRIKLYVKTACLKAHVLINTVVKKELSKISSDALFRWLPCFGDLFCVCCKTTQLVKMTSYFLSLNFVINELNLQQVYWKIYRLDAIYFKFLVTTLKKWQISYHLFSPACHTVVFLDEEVI